MKLFPRSRFAFQFGQALAILLLTASTSAAAEQAEVAKLNWANGDQLAGELVVRRDASAVAGPRVHRSLHA